MFAKVFSQIFDSSIADDYLVRHVFIDFLILSDRHGVVDMTVEAIARRTNVPEEMVRRGIERLTSPDERSRSNVEDGRRLVPIDSHRDWGWQIVNYRHYRNIVDEESRKAYFRDKQRVYRSKNVKDVSDNSTLLKKITHAEAEADVDTEALKSKSIRADARSTTKGRRIPDDFQVTALHRDWARLNGLPSPDLHIEAFRDFWLAKPGKDGTKLNWDATFRTWIRNSVTRNGGNGNGRNKPSLFDAIRDSARRPNFD